MAVSWVVSGIGGNRRAGPEIWSSMNRRNATRRWKLRFGTRTLLVLTAIIAMLCGAYYWLQSSQREFESEQLVLDQIAQANQIQSSVFFYHHEFNESGKRIPLPESPGPGWIRWLCSDEIFVRLHSAHYQWFEGRQAQELERLTELQNLRRLSLRNAGGILDCSSIQGCTELRVLDLSGCKDLESLEGLSALTKLEQLSLEGCSSLTHLRGIGQLQNLERMILRDCVGLTDISQLEGLPNLESIDLSGCTSLRGVEALLTLPKLKTVHLTNESSIPSATLQKLNSVVQRNGGSEVAQEQ